VAWGPGPVIRQVERTWRLPAGAPQRGSGRRRPGGRPGGAARWGGRRPPGAEDPGAGGGRAARAAGLPGTFGNSDIVGGTYADPTP